MEESATMMAAEINGFRSSLDNVHGVNTQPPLQQQTLVRSLSQQQQQQQIHGMMTPPVLKIPIPALQQTLLLSSTTGALVGVEPLAPTPTHPTQLPAFQTFLPPPSIPVMQQPQITHNLIPLHLQTFSLPLSLNGTPGYQPALIAAASLMQAASPPPTALTIETVLQAMLLAQTQQQLTVPSPPPPPPVIGLTVQDRFPATPPVYNGINLLFPGVKQVHANPPIYVVEDFLSPLECDCLIHAAEDCWSPAPVVGKGAGEISPSRTSSTFYLSRDDFQEYMQKVSELTGKPVQHFELPQVGRYLPTQQYRHHFDAFDLSQEDGRRFAANGGQRVVTLLTYLNDCTRGGQTEFPALSLRVTPKRGMALVFFPATVDGYLDKAALHAALPAVDEKYVSQVWIRQGDYHHISSSASSVDNETHTAVQIADEENSTFDSEITSSGRAKRSRSGRRKLPTSVSLLTTASLCFFLMTIYKIDTVTALSLNKSKSRPKGGQRTASSNSRWFQKRKSGVKVSRRKKPPQWEREGDNLYSSSVNSPQSVSGPSQEWTVEQAQELLRPFEVTHGSMRPEGEVAKEPNDEIIASEKPFLWGGLSVGPLWKARLVRAGYDSPTPIQAEAFKAILSKQKPNVVIASPTGSGKTLAFLLPFLTTLNMSTEKSKSQKASKSSDRCLWVVTPTLELGCQIQRAIEALIVPEDQQKNSVVHVLQSHQIGNNDSAASSFSLLSQILESKENVDDLHPPPILAGTPKMFLQLQREIKFVTTRRYKLDHEEHLHLDPKLQKLAKTLRNNPSAVILDEADRLLQTSESSNPATSPPKHRMQRTIPAARKLLETLATSSPQVVCASATVGRNLRRQLMEILQEPSMDNAAELVTADMRTKKSADNRKAALLPATLQHAYHLIRTKNESDKDSSAMLLNGLIDSLDSLDAMPSIVFPGPAGVKKTMEFLSSQGFQDIRGLDSLRQSYDDNSENADNKSEGGWQTTPIYVIKERLGRGLDLPEIRYVFVLGVPSNAASYTHIAGRTARKDTGTAVTILEPKEAPKLVSLAETLGLSFSGIDRN